MSPVFAGTEEEYCFMSRLKLVLLSLGAALAMSAVASSSASAVLANLYFEQPSKALGTETIVGTVGKAQLQAESGNTKVLLECTTNKLEEGKIEFPGKSSGKITYEGCKVFIISKGVKTFLSVCKVKPIIFKFLDKLITQTKAGVVADEFKPTEAPELFVTIFIEGVECPLAGVGGVAKEYKVKGTYVASLDDQAEEDQTEHELIFTEAGSSLTFEGSPASYTNIVKIKRENGKEWYVD
jgi:hypothetical protein